MRNVEVKKSNTGVILASLLGLTACLVLGAWFMMQDGGEKPTHKPVKPTTEVSR